VARERITEELVRHWNNLRERTGDNPSGVMHTVAEHPDLAVSLQRLHEILEQIEHHRRFSKRRFVVQAHAQFREALLDFIDRWRTYAAYGPTLVRGRGLRPAVSRVDRTNGKPSK
jgi:hypothetical protein